MKINPDLYSFFFPRTMEVKPSDFNGKIKIVKFGNHYAAWVGGFEQSGPIVAGLWKKATDNIEMERGGKLLILGLGCGAMVNYLAKKFPQAQIVGVEIDPVMLALGKKYFGLGKTAPLKIVNDDALSFLNNSKQAKFDLIAVDLYNGRSFDKRFTHRVFFNKLDQNLTKTGTLIFNLLTTKSSNFEPGKFLDKLAPFFVITKKIRVNYTHTIYNTVVFCSRKKKHPDTE